MEDGHQSNPYNFNDRFIYNRLFINVENQVEYKLDILQEWDAKKSYAMTCHAQCIALNSSHLSQSFFRAIWYSYDPPPQELARRDHWLWSQFVQFLYGVLRRFSIPLEVCHMIVGNFSTRELLIFTANTFWLETEKELKNRHQLSLDADVWARYVEFQDSKYIASLQNTPRGQHMSKLYSLDPARNIKSIHLSEDHLGIRDVRFAGSSTEEINFKYLHFNQTNLDSGRFGTVELLLQHGSDINFGGHVLSSVETARRGMNQPLWYQDVEEKTKIVEHLLDIQANANVANRLGAAKRSGSQGVLANQI